MSDSTRALTDAAALPSAMSFGPRVRPRKAAHHHECESFEQLPNVGPAMATKRSISADFV